MEAWTISAAELHEGILRGHISEILDVRNSDEFEEQRLETRREVPMRHAPVYEVLEEPERFAGDTLDDAIVICGHGNGSALVVQEFNALGKETRSLAGGMEAWAQLLVPMTIEGLPEPVRAWQLQRPAKGCLSYVIGVPGEKCIVVDPARHHAPYLRLAESHDMRVTHVIDTHVHADHISGGPALAEHLGVEYHLPPEDSAEEIPFQNRALSDGEEIELGAETVMRAMTMHLPGHTPGTTALLVGERLLLVGDTIFVRGLGRPDLTGQAEDLARSLFAQRPRPAGAARPRHRHRSRALVEPGGVQRGRHRDHHAARGLRGDPAQRAGRSSASSRRSCPRSRPRPRPMTRSGWSTPGGCGRPRTSSWCSTSVATSVRRPPR